jgi:hypothetical protein
MLGARNQRGGDSSCVLRDKGLDIERLNASIAVVFQIDKSQIVSIERFLVRLEPQSRITPENVGERAVEGAHQVFLIHKLHQRIPRENKLLDRIGVVRVLGGAGGRAGGLNKAGHRACRRILRVNNDELDFRHVAVGCDNVKIRDGQKRRNNDEKAERAVSTEPAGFSGRQKRIPARLGDDAMKLNPLQGRRNIFLGLYRRLRQM